MSLLSTTQSILILFISSTYMRDNGVRGQGGTYTGTNPFSPGDTAVFSPGTTVTNPEGSRVLYPAGICITFINPTYIRFPPPTTIYILTGPTVYPAETTVLFPTDYRICLAPGTRTVHPTSSSLLYKTFYGYTSVIVTYNTAVNVSYRDSSSQPGYFPAVTNPINYYNPGVSNTGGTTQFGRSAPYVDSIINKPNSDGTMSSITVTGYTVEGWPRRIIRNLQRPTEVSDSIQISQDTYRVTTNGNTITVMGSNLYLP